MAYSRQKSSACPVPADPGIVPFYVPLTTAEATYPVKVPWDKVKLVYAYTMYLPTNVASGALDGGDWSIKLELEAGTDVELMDITITNAATVGTIDEGSYTSEADSENLMDSDIINIVSDGHASSTVGGAMVFMYFEHCS